LAEITNDFKRKQKSPASWIRSGAFSSLAI